MKKKEKCADCGGVLVLQKVTYDKKADGKRVVFENVPAAVCSSCDEVWIEGKVAEKMEKIFRKGEKPTRWLKVPLWSLSKAA